MRSWRESRDKGQKRLFRRAKTVNNPERTISISTSYVIWSRTRSCSSSGAGIATRSAKNLLSFVAAVQILCDHAMGNYRVLTQMAAELLAAATQRQRDQLDEKLFLELYGPPQQPARRKTAH